MLLRHALTLLLIGCASLVGCGSDEAAQNSSVKRQLSVESKNDEAPSRSSTVAIVAHEDDDLLFLSPSLFHVLRQKRLLRVVYLTAGDAGKTGEYWPLREKGVRAAYDSVLRNHRAWKQGVISAGGRTWTRFIYPGKNARLELVFLRLPDGNLLGNGFSRHDNASLEKLWDGRIASITPVDGDVGVSRESLISILGDLQKSPGTSKASITLHTLNCRNAPQQLRDHSDHHFASMFAVASQQKVENAEAIYLHWGYDSLDHLENISEYASIEKWKSFGAYAADDSDLLRVAPKWRQKSLYEEMRRREFAWSRTPQNILLRDDRCFDHGSLPYEDTSFPSLPPPLGFPLMKVMAAR